MTSSPIDDNPLSSLIPVTLLSGSLGAGKTTVLKKLLSPSNGLKIAVIENEFASIGIDDQMIDGDAETVITLADGCICCSIGEDLERTLISLIERKDKGDLSFERVIIECSGMADPGPITQVFLSEPFVSERYQLDGVVTLVDALHADQQLDRPITQAQIGFADKLLLTKCDQVAAPVLTELSQRLNQINRRAPVLRIEHGHVDINEILCLNGFELEGDPKQLLFSRVDDELKSTSSRHSSLINTNSLHSAAKHHGHNPRISSLVLESLYPLSLDGLSIFMNELLEEHGHQLLRYKGILDIEGADERLLFQGVFRLYNFDWDRPWGDEPRKSVVVFIGEHLPEDKIRESFARATERMIP